jgi:hypothetical protein
MKTKLLLLLVGALALLVMTLAGCTAKKEPLPERTSINLPPPLVPEAEKEPEIQPEDQWTEKTFTGTWVTTRNRRLDGIMNCHIRRNGAVCDCRFWGRWQGIDFEYNVKMDGELEDLNGHQITIDGARYKWTGNIKDGAFQGEFESNRYDGSFDLKEKVKTVPYPEK